MSTVFYQITKNNLNDIEAVANETDNFNLETE